MREARLRYWHGENWTDEDQEKFEKERNRRQCSNHRNAHRQEYTDYQNTYQKKFRAQNPYYYGWKQYLRLHPECGLSYEQYIKIREDKKAKKQQKENEND
jgi:hypothetical protein